MSSEVSSHVIASDGFPTTMGVEFANWVRELAVGDGSDLHVKVGSPPLIREDGQLRRLERPSLTPRKRRKWRP